MVEEMPDNWENVYRNEGDCLSAVGKRYVRYYNRIEATGTNRPSAAYQTAECLFMVVAYSGFAPEALEMFRPDEVGDVDGDKANEFLDGWGNPIAFLRWAPGFSTDTSPIDNLNLRWRPNMPLPATPRTYSAVQFADATRHHDSMDPLNSDPSAFDLTPLIYSPGADEAGNTNSAGSNGYGIFTGATAWPMQASALRTDICLSGTVKQDSATGNPITVLVGAPDPDNKPDPNAFRDNITNHDLMAR
jgi:hypothetical protein